MNDKQRPQCESVIDYHPTGMEIIEISPLIQYPTPIQHCTWRLQVQSFIVRKERNFTDAQGGLTERQPLQISCQTIYPQVIQTLATLKCGDKVDIIGRIIPYYRGYVADGTPDGDRFVIPDCGSEPVMSPKGQVIQPSAEPWRAAKGVPNFHVSNEKQVLVTELTPSLYTDNIDRPKLGHDNIYWKQLSRWYRQEKSWECEGCSENFENDRMYLDVHHVRGRAFNNPEAGDLKVLCVRCHAKQTEPDDHSHMKNGERYKEFVRKFPE